MCFLEPEVDSVSAQGRARGRRIAPVVPRARTPGLAASLLGAGGLRELTDDASGNWPLPDRSGAQSDLRQQAINPSAAGGS
jgi:hypothetical protein